MEEEYIDYNHIQYPSNLSAVANNKMKPRIKHEGLASNHRVSPDGDKSNRHIVVLPDLEELYEEG